MPVEELGVVVAESEYWVNSDWDSVDWDPELADWDPGAEHRASESACPELAGARWGPQLEGVVGGVVVAAKLADSAPLAAWAPAGFARGLSLQTWRATEWRIVFS